MLSRLWSIYFLSLRAHTAPPTTKNPLDIVFQAYTAILHCIGKQWSIFLGASQGIVRGGLGIQESKYLKLEMFSRSE